MQFKFSMNNSKTQLGFSLIEVLVSMLIATIAVGGAMLIHGQNLNQVADNSNLNNAELILSNAAHRMQVNRLALIGGNYNGSFVAGNPPASNTVCVNQACKWAVNIDLPALKTQMIDAGLAGATLNVADTSTNSWLVKIQWPAHNQTLPVWRNECGKAAVGNTNNCLAIIVTP